MKTIEMNAELHVADIGGEDYDYFEEITIANNPRQPYLVDARWFNEQTCNAEEVTVWDFEEDGNELDLETAKARIVAHAKKAYTNAEYVEVN